MKRGDVCRARCTAPARYLGEGKCVYVSAMCNEVEMDEARTPQGDEERFPLPSDADLDRMEREMAKGVKSPGGWRTMQSAGGMAGSGREIPTFTVTQRFHRSGEWIVHQPGPNREHKLAYFATEQEARACADRINAWLREYVEREEER